MPVPLGEKGPPYPIGEQEKGKRRERHKGGQREPGFSHMGWPSRSKARGR